MPPERHFGGRGVAIVVSWSPDTAEGQGGVEGALGVDSAMSGWEEEPSA